jgi:ureidoacrylate peracid hydrolase
VKPSTTLGITFFRYKNDQGGAPLWMETQKTSTRGRLFEMSAGWTTIIEAKPGPLTVNCAETAVIVVDMQNDFCSKGRMFDRAGINISAVQKAVGPTRKVLFAARGAGIRIVYLKMGFRADLSDLGDTDSANRVRHLRFGIGQPCIASDGRQGRFLIRDTWNTDVIEEVRPQPEDVVLYKRRFSGFYQTELDDTLRSLGIKDLILTGCTTSVCVDSTIRDAMFREYRCVLLADCAGEPMGSELPRSNHEASVLTIQTVLGWVSGSERFESALLARRPVAAAVDLSQL